MIVLVIALVILLAILCNYVERCEQTLVMDRWRARSKCILLGNTHVSIVGDRVGDSVGDCVGDCVGDFLQLRRKMRTNFSLGSLSCTKQMHTVGSHSRWGLGR